MQTDPTSHNIVGPSMLGVVGQQCWVRLHGLMDLKSRTYVAIYKEPFSANGWKQKGVFKESRIPGILKVQH